VPTIGWIICAFCIVHGDGPFGDLRFRAENALKTHLPPPRSVFALAMGFCPGSDLSSGSMLESEVVSKRRSVRFFRLSLAIVALVGKTRKLKTGSEKFETDFLKELNQDDFHYLHD